LCHLNETPPLLSSLSLLSTADFGLEVVSSISLANAFQMRISSCSGVMGVMAFFELCDSFFDGWAFEVSSKSFSVHCPDFAFEASVVSVDAVEFTEGHHCESLSFFSDLFV